MAWVVIGGGGTEVVGIKCSFKWVKSKSCNLGVDGSLETPASRLISQFVSKER